MYTWLCLERLSKFIYHTIYPQSSYTNINSLPSSLSPSFPAGYCVAYAILFMILVESPPRGWCLAATVHWLFPSSEFPLMVVPAKWSHEEERKGEWRDCEEKRVGVKVPLRVKVGSHTSNVWETIEWRDGEEDGSFGKLVQLLALPQGEDAFAFFWNCCVLIIITTVHHTWHFIECGGIRAKCNFTKQTKKKNAWRFYTWLGLQWMAKSLICVCFLSIFF